MSLSTTTQAQITASLKTDSNNLVIFFSEAEVRVITNKARKAGLHVNEYIRNAALGFPMP